MDAHSVSKSVPVSGRDIPPSLIPGRSDEMFDEGPASPRPGLRPSWSADLPWAAIPQRFLAELRRSLPTGMFPGAWV